MIAILILGIFFLGVAIRGVIVSATSRRLRTAQRLATIDEYGFRGGAPEPGVPVRVPSGTAEFVARVGDAFAQRIGQVSEQDLRAELMAAGLYGTTPRTLLGYRVLAAIVLPILVLLAGSFRAFAILLAGVMVLLGWMLPLIIVRRQARLRLGTIDRRLPDLIDLLVVTIEAGLGFAAALRVAADQLDGPLSDELRLTLQEQTMGLGLGEALSHLANRADTPATRSFVRAMAQGERLGISTGQIMRNLSIDMRKRRRKQAEEKAQKAPIKMLFPLVFLIFPSLFVVLLVPAMLRLLTSL